MTLTVRVALFAASAVALILIARYHRPSARAARAESYAASLCKRRYRAAQTAADTAALDPLRTLTPDGEAQHSCRELRLAGRTN